VCHELYPTRKKEEKKTAISPGTSTQWMLLEWLKTESSDSVPSYGGLAMAS